MSAIKRKLALLSLPLLVIGVTGVVVKMVILNKDSRISEAVRDAVRNAFESIDTIVSDIKNSIEGRSGNQIERSIDGTVENAKRGLDQMAEQIKSRLKDAC